MSQPPQPPLRAVLNTWFLLYLNRKDPAERTLGGLPNDFLTHGAASLFILDHVICDDDGLITEAAMPWVSSHIFRVLRDEQLLRPERLADRYSTLVFDRLRESGLLRWARQTMDAELAKLKSGDVATDDLALPSTLRWLNSVMFMGIDLPDVLHYDYHESHFSNLALTEHEVTTAVAPQMSEASAAEREAVKTGRLLKALSLAVPDFTLLPPITSGLARSALRENIRSEKRMMYRYVYGDMPHTEYEAFRSASDFQQRDAIIDSLARYQQADKNLELLLRVRRQTAAVRPYAQNLIRDVVNGARALEDVAAELSTIKITIESAIEHESRAQELRILAGAYALLGVGEVFEALHTKHAIHAFGATAAFAEAFRQWREASETRNYQSVLGRQFPLAWIAGVYRRER